MNNKMHHGRRGGSNDFDRNNRLSGSGGGGGQQREFFNQNNPTRFGPPNLNGPPAMNMRGGSIQNFGLRNNFMWQPRSG